MSDGKSTAGGRDEPCVEKTVDDVDRQGVLVGAQQSNDEASGSDQGEDGQAQVANGPDEMDAEVAGAVESGPSGGGDTDSDIAAESVSTPETDAPEIDASGSEAADGDESHGATHDEPEPTEPAAIEPLATEPESTEPVATESLATESVPNEPDDAGSDDSVSVTDQISITGEAGSSGDTSGAEAVHDSGAEVGDEAEGGPVAEEDGGVETADAGKPEAREAAVDDEVAEESAEVASVAAVVGGSDVVAVGASDVLTDRAVVVRDAGSPARTGSRLRGRDPLWAKLAIAFGLALVLLSGGTVGAGMFLINRYEHTVTQETLLAPEARVAVPPEQHHSSVKGPLNFLLLGSDARADNPSNGQRSDTIIIAHVPASMDRAYLISIPRDLRVHIPAYQPTGFRGAYEKINGAFQYGGGGNGGVQLLSQTLSSVLGIQFDGAAIIDFSGFSKVVDELGGIDMCVDQRVESIHIGFDKDGKFLAPRTGSEAEYRNPLSTPKVYEPGCQHFAGWEALDYVRQRKTLPNGDYDRQRHQQQFLRAILAKARDEGLNSDPLLIDKLLRAIGDSLTVDANGVPLADLAFALRAVLPGAIGGVTVPSEPQMIGGVSYVIGLPEQEALYRALREDRLESWAVQNPTWYNQK